MADVLRIKRRLAGGASGAPAALKNAELAFNEQDNILYYGKGDSGGNATSIIPVGGPGAFQPLDADLTALAGLTGVNVIYYRSAADTWAAVTIGTGLSFSGGTLSATGGAGGGIPEPASDGFYGRNMASGVGSWVAAVQKAGDTMTGNLTLPGNPSSALQAAPKQYVDTMLPLAGGTLTGDLTISKSNPVLFLNKTASGQTTNVLGQTGGSARWRIDLGNGTPESGGNVGSDFAIARFNDAGVAVDMPIFIQRAGGYMALGRSANGNLDGTARAAQMSFRYIDWGLVARSADAATHSPHAFLNSSGSVVGSIDTTTTNTSFTTTSDARLKEHGREFTRGREIIDRLSVQDFRWKNGGGADVGMMAQDVYEVFPHAVTQGQGEPDESDFVPWRIDNSKLVPVLIAALQDAFREIDALKAQMAGR